MKEEKTRDLNDSLETSNIKMTNILNSSIPSKFEVKASNSNVKKLNANSNNKSFNNNKSLNSSKNKNNSYSDSNHQGYNQSQRQLVQYNHSIPVAPIFQQTNQHDSKMNYPTYLPSKQLNYQPNNHTKYQSNQQFNNQPNSQSYNNSNNRTHLPENRTQQHHDYQSPYETQRNHIQSSHNTNLKNLNYSYNERDYEFSYNHNYNSKFNDNNSYHSNPRYENQTKRARFSTKGNQY